MILKLLLTLFYVIGLSKSETNSAYFFCKSHGYGYCCVFGGYFAAQNTESIIYNDIETTHDGGKSDSDVKFLHYWTEYTRYLPTFDNGLIASKLPSLDVYIIEGKNRDINLSNTLTRENFRGFPMISRLGINDCEVEVLAEDIFSDLGNLKNLNLNRNRIRELPSKLLIKNPNLDQFDAVDNEIEVIPKDFFASNRRLVNVDFSNNLLRKIYADFAHYSLQSVRLGNNICINKNFMSMGIFGFGSKINEQLKECHDDESI